MTSGSGGGSGTVLPGADGAARRRTELISGLLLIGAAALAVLVANSPWAPVYDRLLDVDFEVRLGEAALKKPILLWVNDGLMAVFFLLVGLELKREFIEGALSSWDKVVLPLSAAIGGVLLPVGIYIAFNFGSESRLQGWAIPAATDIAFAVGLLALFGSRVPAALRTFLLSLAVFDDIAAIVIIAFAYTERISWGAKGLAIGVVVILVVMNRLRVTRYGVYILVGAVLWVCVLKSGVHATLAGVILGLTIPRRPNTALGLPPLHELEHVLRPWVAFVILPLFAFMNAGVTLRGIGADALVNPVTLGVGSGLLVGKLAGVFGTTCLLTWLGVSSFPENTRRIHFLGVAALAGVGFTMSLFIGVLAFESAPRSYDVPVRIGVLGGSALSATLGLILLARSLPAQPE